MSISPFPTPTYAKLESWHAVEIKNLLQNKDRQNIVHVGQLVVRSSTMQLPAHFHRLCLQAERPIDVERSLKRGACFGFGMIAMAQHVTIEEDAFAYHMQDLNAYRGDGESFASAAVRLGTNTLELDEVMAECADYVADAHPSSAHDPAIIKAGIGYAEIIAERVLRNAAEPESSPEALNAQFSTELSGLFNDIGNN